MTAAAGREPHRHGRLLRAFVAVSASLALVAAVGTAFAAIRYVDVRDVGTDDFGDLGPVGPDGPSATASPVPDTSRCAEEACNYLILGSDSREGLTPEEQERYGTDDDIGGENRADTIMLVHLDPDLEKAIILSFPRDLWVEVPGHGWDKINAGFEGGLRGGGPQMMARTVANLTGLRIDHVLYVDLAGFQGIVDTLGGVDMCIPGYNADPGTGRIQDPLTGLDIAPGCQRLDGQQALAYVRTRHLRCDTIPDFARIGRQQQFLRAVINQMLQPEQLLRAPTLIEPILANMSRDGRFEVGDLIYLVGELRGLSTGAAEFRSVPGYGGVQGGLSVVMMDPSANEIFDAIREGRPITGVGEQLLNTPPSEANVEVAAVDAGGGADAAGVLTLLSQAGFAVGAEVASPRDVGIGSRPRSVIAYAPGHEAEAEVVRSYLPHLSVVEVPGLDGVDAAVIVAADYRPPSEGGIDPDATGCPAA
ncbi:MAG TPA: LCP family protein [Actinomycetota bacterium]